MAEFVENRKVLYVEDEENLSFAFKSLMRNQKVEVYILNDSTVIEEFLKANGPFAVVLSDQRMPGKDGVAVLREVVRTSPDTMRVLVTGYADMEAIKGAVNVGGIIQYISKPWDDSQVRLIVADLVSRYNIAMERRFLLNELKLKNETLQLLLDGTVAGVVKLLSDVSGSIGDEAAAQNVRVNRLGQAILKMMADLNGKEKWEVSRALELFNLGLVLLPPVVRLRINKEGIGVLNQIPAAKNHHLMAAELLKSIPQFESVANIILLMRKQFDGAGEPNENKIKGKDLPLGSRILKILLDLDALSAGESKGVEILGEMKKKSNVYDGELINRLLGFEPAHPRKRRDIRMPVQSLNVGMVLLEDIVTRNGQHLLWKNSTLTETTCKLLSQWDNMDPIASPVYVLLDEEVKQ
ncbi:MAG TPA: HD domain-containing phosphohydrolase [Candidatus Acidoferrales bacterium]|nr:HD domain-containing phosphohydrolase [Candidatus Acidoferrales bacterium]